MRELVQRERRDLDLLHDWLDRHDEGAITPDAEGRRKLARAGWEVKGGILHAPTSQGALVTFYPEAVLFDSQREDEFSSRARLAVQPAYRKALLRYIEVAVRTVVVRPTTPRAC